MLRFIAISTSFVCCIAYSASAFACKCLPDGKEASYKSSKVVFYGQTSEDGSSIDVIKSYKGTKRKRTHKIVVEDPCDVTFEADKTYMVYASWDNKKKKTVKVSSCKASKQIDFQPISALAWSYNEELPYGTSRTAVKKYSDRRAKMEEVAMDGLKRAAKKCDKKTWYGKEKVAAHLQVRFDLKPTGEFEPTLLTVKPKTDAESTPLDSCLMEHLTKTKFKKFGGGPVSVRVYWVLDRIDRQMKREKSGSQVILYKSDPSKSRL